MFARVFLPDSGLESTFAQNKSCRFFLPLQLLFWPNFKLPYEILSSSRSKLRQKSVKRVYCAPLLSTVLGAHTAADRRRPPRVARAGESRSPRTVLIRSPGLIHFLRPLLPPRVHAEPSPSRARRRRPSGRMLPSRLDSARPEPRNLALHLHRPSLSPFVPFPGRIGPAPAGRH